MVDFVFSLRAPYCTVIADRMHGLSAASSSSCQPPSKAHEYKVKMGCCISLKLMRPYLARIARLALLRSNRDRPHQPADWSTMGSLTSLS